MGLARSTVLVVEDDLEVRNYLELALQYEGYDVEKAQDGEEALAYLEKPRKPVSVVLLDIMMPGKDGFATLDEIRRLDRALPVVMVSSNAAPMNVVEAMRLGANDFLIKPVNHGDLRKAVKRALAKVPPPAPIGEPAVAPVTDALFGAHPMMREIQAILPQIGWSEAPVLIQGETGVGKEVLARALHANSPRSARPLLKVNCAALPSELVESELFGYEKGAFTGAFQKKPGLFECADQGTILLDEIGDMDFRLQAKLLQVLQDHEFKRVGGRETIRVDVRVICATHRDLQRAISENAFRQDLYYRLNVINLRIPPLRERKEDLIDLTEFLIQKHLNGREPMKLTPALKNALLAHDWPGNVRELENFVRRLLVLRDPHIVIRELRAKVADAVVPQGDACSPAEPAAESVEAPLEKVYRTKDETEADVILAALKATCWKRKKAAELLNIEYKAFLYRMKKLRIEEKAAAAAPAPK